MKDALTGMFNKKEETKDSTPKVDKNLIEQDVNLEWKDYQTGKLYYIDPRRLELDNKNTYKVDEDKVSHLVDYIKDFGQMSAIFVNKRNGRVFAGNTRLETIKRITEDNLKNDLEPLLVKVEFFDIDSISVENTLANIENKTFEAERTAKSKSSKQKVINDMVREVQKMKKNGEFFNGSSIKNVNHVVAMRLGVKESQVKFYVNQEKKQKEKESKIEE